MSKIPVPAAFSPRGKTRPPLSEVTDNSRPPIPSKSAHGRLSEKPPKYGLTQRSDSNALARHRLRSVSTPIALIENAPNPDLNHVQKLVGLSRRAGASAGSPSHSQSVAFVSDVKLEQRMSKIEERYSNDIQHQLTVSRELEKSMDELRRSIETQHAGINELKRLEKKILREIDDMAHDIKSKEGEVDRCASQVTQKFEYQEKMCSVQLLELEQHLKRDSAIMEKELLEELAKVEDYRDDETQAEIEAMREKTKQAQQALYDGKLARVEELNALRTRLEAELRQCQVDQEAGMAKSEGELTQNRLEVAKGRVLAETLKAKVRTLQQKNQTVLEQLESILQNRGSFEATRHQVMTQIARVKAEILDYDSQISVTQIEVNRMREIHASALEKLNHEKKLQRRIENSIQDMGGKLRSYVKLQGEASPSMRITNEAQASSELQFHSEHFTFDKVFPIEFPQDAFVQEYSCLVEDSLAGNDVAVLYFGSNVLDSLMEVVRFNVQNMSRRAEKYARRGWKFEFGVEYLQFSEAENIWRDLLSQDQEVVFDQQKMEFQKAGKVLMNEASDVLSHAQIYEDAVELAFIHVYGVKSDTGKEIRSKVQFLDISRLPVSGQEAGIHQRIVAVENNSTKSLDNTEMHDLGRLLNHCFFRSKLLGIIGIHTHADDALRLLKLAERLKDTSCLYKHNK